MVGGIESINFDVFTVIAKHLGDRSLTNLGKTCAIMENFVKMFFEANVIKFRYWNYDAEVAVTIRLDRGLIAHPRKSLFVMLNDLYSDWGDLIVFAKLAIQHSKMPKNVCIPFIRSTLDGIVIPCLCVKNAEGKLFEICNLDSCKCSQGQSIIDDIRTFPKKWIIFKYQEELGGNLDEYTQANRVVDDYLKKQPFSRI